MDPTGTNTVQQNQLRTPRRSQPCSLGRDRPNSKQQGGTFFYPPQSGSQVPDRIRYQRLGARVSRIYSRFRTFRGSGRGGDRNDQIASTQPAYPNCPKIYVPPSPGTQNKPCSTTAPEQSHGTELKGETSQEPARSSMHDSSDSAEIDTAARSSPGIDQTTVDLAVSVTSIRSNNEEQTPDDCFNIIPHGDVRERSSGSAPFATHSYPNCRGIVCYEPSSRN